MAYERVWPAVSPQAFIADGTIQGTLQLADTTGFYVKQNVSLQSIALPQPFPLQVKRIDPNGTIHLGPPGDIVLRQNISMYLLADSATIYAPEQNIPLIKPDDIFNALYERDPIKALRSILVDTDGSPWSSSNPMPVSPGGFNLPVFDDVKKVLDPNDLPLFFNFFKNTVQVAQIQVFYNANLTSIEFKRTM